MVDQIQNQDDQEFWAALVPELVVSDIQQSLHFYCSICGFQIRFGRPEDRFVYLELGQAQIMLEEYSEHVWLTGQMEPPFGRGLNLQIKIDDAARLYERLKSSGLSFYRPLKAEWYRHDNIEHGQMQFLVQDPDGYLLRFAQYLGTRPTHSG